MSVSISEGQIIIEFDTNDNILITQSSNGDLIISKQ